MTKKYPNFAEEANKIMEMFERVSKLGDILNTADKGSILYLAREQIICEINRISIAAIFQFHKLNQKEVEDFMGQETKSN